MVLVQSYSSWLSNSGQVDSLGGEVVVKDVVVVTGPVSQHDGVQDRLHSQVFYIGY